MSSLIVAHDSHLMMLEIVVRNLFVPWTSDFDRVILKKTTVMFRMLDEEWTSLSPNRQDRRPYRGTSCENENFYGGGSVVFCVPSSFLEKKACGVDVQFNVRKEVCKYFELDQCQDVGSVVVPVDDLLNSIANQLRERNELAEHLSDFYKRQIISRSTTGTYVLPDRNFRDTAATISLYIRISYLGKCLITEITRIESRRGPFSARGELDEKEPYWLQQLTQKDLQSGRWDVVSARRVPRGRLICRCKELAIADLAALGDRTVEDADEKAIGDEAISGDQGDVRKEDLIDSAIRDATAKGKARAIKDKALKKARERRRGTTTVTVGLAERPKKICAPSPSFSCLQAYPLCCRLQPVPTCFIPCPDALSCYCHWMACPPQFLHPF